MEGGIPHLRPGVAGLEEKYLPNKGVVVLLPIRVRVSVRVRVRIRVRV